MAYNSNVYDTTTNVNTLQQRIEDNLALIVQNFIGTSSPSGTGVPTNGMLWVDTSSNKVKIRSGSTWIEIFDYLTGAPSLKDQQVETRHISDDARKGSIVQGEHIDPASCTHRARPVVVSLPTMGSHENKITTTQSTFQTVRSYYVYIPSEVTNLYMSSRARILGVGYQVTFAVNGINAATSTRTNTSFQWVDDIATIDVSRGWATLDIKLRVTSGGTAELQGFSFRSNDVT